MRGGAAALLMLMTAWVVPGASASAADGPAVVLDEASFLANNDIVSTQRFDTPEEWPIDQKLITIDDVNYESMDPANPYWRVESGRLIRAFSEQGPETDDFDLEITFGSDQAVHAIGLHLASSGRNDPDPFEFTVVEADGTSTVFPFDLYVTGPLYVGFTSDIGFVSVTIHEAMTDEGVWNYSLDDVSHSALADVSVASATIEFTYVEATRLGEDDARLLLEGVIQLQEDLLLRAVGAEVKIADVDRWWHPDSGIPVSSPVAHSVRIIPTDNPGEFNFTTTINIFHDSTQDPPTDPTHQFDPVVATIVVDTALADTTAPGPTFRQASDTIDIPAFIPGERILGTITRLESGQPESNISVNLFVRAADGSRGRYLGNSKTESDGRYLHLVEPGCYVLTFIAPVGNHFLDYRTGPGYRYLNRSVCVTEGQQPRLDATVLADESVNASISGQATLDGGSPVGGVNVTLFLADTTTGYTQRGQYLGSTRTGDDGGYRHDVAAGCYVLTFIAQAGDEFSNGNRYLNRSVCVDDANQLGDIDVTLSRGG